MVEAGRDRLAEAGLRGIAADLCNEQRGLVSIGERKVDVSLSKDETRQSSLMVRKTAQPGYHPSDKASSSTLGEAVEWPSGQIYAFLDDHSLKNSVSSTAQDIGFGTKSADLWPTGHGLF